MIKRRRIKQRWSNRSCFLKSEWSHAILVSCFLLGTSCLEADATAQQSPDWKVMRIDIPVEEAPRLATQGYKAIRVNELAELLKKEAERRQQLPLRASRLAEATYIARLDNKWITSEQSRWVFTGDPSSGPYKIERLSLALERLVGSSAMRPQLLDHLATSPDGKLSIDHTAGKQVFWFGFSLSADNREGESYRFRLPIAASARMLIATSAAERLVSSQVVVEPIDNPAEYLGRNWPEPANLAWESAEQWWLVHLSGKAEFELSVRQQTMGLEAGYRHILRSSSHDYVPREFNFDTQRTSLDVTSTFEFLDRVSSSDLRLRKSSKLRVSSIVLDGRNVAWRILPSQVEGQDVLEILSAGDSMKTSQIVVSASCDHSQDSVLPEIVLADSFTVSGMLQIFSRQDVLVDAISTPQAVLRSAEIDREATDGDSRRLQARVPWIGDFPVVEVGFATRVSRWKASSLTRFSVQSDWLNANCRIRLDADRLNSQEVRISVGQGWFVDQVRLVDVAEPDVRAQFFERGSQQEPVTDVVVSWQAARQRISLELEVAAHRPLSTDRDRIRLFTQRLLTIADADQVDNYVIEPSGRYQVEVGAGLLLFQLQPTDLPFWQQQLLTDPSKKWIFQGLRNLIPPIDLVAKRGAYNAKLITTFSQPETDSLRGAVNSIHYLLRIEPISNPIEAVALSIPQQWAKTQMAWSIQSGSDSGPEIVTHQLNTSGTLIHLDLPEPRDSSFTVRSKLNLNNGVLEQAVPIVGLPEATTSESLVVMPAELSGFQTGSTVELLPRGLFANDTSLFSDPGWNSFADASSLIVARLDGKKSHSLRLDRQSPSTLPGMVWEESVEHFIDGERRRSHNMFWKVEAAAALDFEVGLPDGWQPVRIAVNGVPLDVDWETRQSVCVPLPGQQSSEVELRCVSRLESTSVFHVERFSRPTLNLGVRSTKHRLHIPPGLIAAEHVLGAFAMGGLWDRLNPHWSWKWMVPTRWLEADSDAPSEGWLSLDLDSGSVLNDGRKVWLLERSTLAGVSLASCMAMTILFYWLFQLRGGLWLVGAGSILMLLILSPATWVVPLQLVMLSASLAVLLRVFQIVFVVRRDERGQATKPGLSSGSSIFPASVVLVLGGLPTVTMSQEMPSMKAPGDTVTARNDNPLYGILTPVSETGELAGEFAYVPSELADLLSRQDGPPRSDGVSLLSASYTLRTSPTTTIAEDYAQFLAAEYEVRVDHRGAELRLPILRSQLPLSRAEIDGQTDYSLISQQRESLVFRPVAPGQYVLKLVFNPVSELDANRRARLAVQIPVVPNATISVIFDSSTDVELFTRGRQVQFDNMITGTLGPVDRIECSWRTADTGPSYGRPVRAASRLWISTQSDHLVAAGLLEIENPARLPDSFRLILDENWEPIGSEWGDVELVSSDEDRFGSRRAFEVRFRSGFPIDSARRANVRLLMTPRSQGPVNNLAAPFLVLEKTGPSVDRILTWSTGDQPRWRLDGLDIWPVLDSSTVVDWGRLELASESTSYRVPLGSDATNLRRLPPPERTLASEITRVHLSVPETRLVYGAQGELPLGSGGNIHVEIPRNSRIQYVRANGADTEFEILRREEREVLVVATQPGSEIYSLDLELSYPTRLTSPTRARPQRLARAVLRNVEVESSVLRVLRTAGLNCDLKSANLESADASLQLAPVVARPFDLLVNLDAVVGQVELGDNFRDSAYLPLEFELSLRRDLDRSSSVLYVERNEDSWSGRLVAQWSTQDQPLDFLFFEIPAELREDVDTGNLPRRFIPMGDPERVTLCLIPPQPVDGHTRVDLRFPLASAVSGQTLNVPHLQLLSLQQSQAESPVVALPKNIAGQRLTWQVGAAMVAEDWQDPFLPEAREAYLFMQPLAEEMQVAWEMSKPVAEESEVLDTQVVLTNQHVTNNQSLVRGYIDYWVQPRSQTKFELLLPDNVKVVGASVGDTPASVMIAEPLRISLLMQPNYLPLHIRVHLQWPVRMKAATNEASLPLPKLVSSKNSGITRLVQLGTDQNWSVTPTETVENEESQSRVEIWGKTVGKAISSATGLDLSEREAWLVGWHPDVVALNRTERLSSLDRSASTGESPAQASSVGIDEFWTSVCDQLQVDPARVEERLNETLLVNPMHRSLRLVESLPDQQEIPLNWSESDTTSVVRLATAGIVLLLIVASMRYALAIQRVYVEVLSAFPWSYWLLLAVLSWIIFPTVWPGAILAFTAAALAFGQYSDYRRTSHLR